jgi:hypothetical protein
MTLCVGCSAELDHLLARRCGPCKLAKKRADQKAYVARHPDRARASRKRYQKTSAKAKAARKRYMAAWRSRHKDKVLAARRRWREKHREQQKVYRRKHYERNREKELARNRLWVANNKDRHRASMQEYRATHGAKPLKALLAAINAVVPAGLVGREDVCQEIMLAVYEGTLTSAQATSRKGIAPFITAFRRQNHEAGGYAVSLDVPMRSGQSWHDVLPAPGFEAAQVEYRA